MLIPFIGPSPHGMMNASALETGPGFHSVCGAFRRHKACYSFTIHRLSGPKKLCMSGLLKTTTPLTELSAPHRLFKKDNNFICNMTIYFGVCKIYYIVNANFFDSREMSVFRNKFK